jgi:ATP-binding cassette subfamily B protein/subfamily B ATP-binding cassette protein MsbA
MATCSRPLVREAAVGERIAALSRAPMTPPRTSRQRYRQFVDDYRRRRLDEIADALAQGKRSDGASATDDAAATADARLTPRPPRRKYLREYLRWLWPHRYRVGTVFFFALLVAGLQMIEPLFMRYIIDRVLLNTGLDTATRFTRLNIAGAAFLAVIVFSNMLQVVKDYRQRLLNTRVMLSLRRALFDRLLHRCHSWGDETRHLVAADGNVDTTTGLQMARLAVVADRAAHYRDLDPDDAELATRLHRQRHHRARCPSSPRRAHPAHL